MSRVLIACTDHIGRAMAGPAIRAWEMARVLSDAGHEVTVVGPRLNDPAPARFQLHEATDTEVRRLERWADVVVVQGLITQRHPVLTRTDRHLVVDLYDPYPLETLEAFADSPKADRLAQHWPPLAGLTVQLRSGDLFLCSNERQRDLWMGMLLAAGRINPDTHSQDHLLRQLLDTAPFGIPVDPPARGSRPVAKAVLPSIEEDARLAIWAGGVYNWFDPLSLIRAWPDVMRRVPAARLLFLGMAHPNPTTPEMAIARRALHLATELGIRDRGVVFNSGWVPYEDRQAYLCEADLGVSMHFEHLETRYSFRTRYLDYIWAGLPIVATEGDAFAGWIEAHGAGAVVPYEDPAAIAAAVAGLLGDDSRRQTASAAVAGARSEFTWERTLGALTDYCRQPWHAADLAIGEGGRRSLGSTQLLDLSTEALTPPRPPGRRLIWYARHEGPVRLAGRVARKVRRILRARRRRGSGAAADV